ncbi:Ligand-binding SRPBCC domain-containing protein [Natronoarchaeum philippinense]|uniref:Ligand-binding SRPBCC domain-containing protein n=1 Tax=Natronoarchaeum philippinense TaxID=558529 RepID=A0A285NVG1_NATPI|nr:SRPBCC family protein [Natronoarchaeum philippinense]SNZ13429.1 Ligand-binding SRPBCC domain-containing protein [Natronoarchaeum philippinense]
MAVFQRETVVHAPLSDVWEFHSTVDGLVALTPDWMGLRVESVVGPDGDSDPDELDTGAEISMSMQPFGVGPRQRWTSRIVERETGDGVARFRDEMDGGPFAHWDHTHSFFARDEDRTVVRDRVEYELPLGAVGRAAGPFAVVGFEPMFRYRHRRTKELLED